MYNLPMHQEIFRKQVENINATLSNAKGRNDIVSFSSVPTKKESVMILCKVKFHTLNIYNSNCNKNPPPPNVILDLQK
jgi:hypothetical protein